MERIDTSKWEEFCLCDLFEFKLPQGDLQVKQIEDGNVPLITPSAYNNGLLQRISSNSKSTLFLANSLTVDMFGNAFYQEEDFFVTAHGHVNVLVPKIPLNKYNGMFMATAIRAMFHEKYGFSEMCTLKVLKCEKVELAVTDNGKIDYAYMDSYMRGVMKESEICLRGLKRADRSKKSIEFSSWHDYRVSDLFDIHPTKAYKLNNDRLLNDNGRNRVVVNSGYNNGIGGYTNYDCTEQAGIITFTDTAAKSVESFFYQDEDFVGYPHVQGMYPKDHKLSKYEGMFIATILRASVGKYDFISKMTREDILGLHIKLPCVSNGSPNWDYMDTYMKDVLESATNDILVFSQI